MTNYQTYNIFAEGRWFQVVAASIDAARADLYEAYGPLEILTWSME